MTALDEYSVRCSEKIVNLHEAALEELEQKIQKSGNLRREKNMYILPSSRCKLENGGIINK